MEETARALGAVSECQGQRPRSGQESRDAGDHLSEGAGLWSVAVSLFGRALTDEPVGCPPHARLSQYWRIITTPAAALRASTSGRAPPRGRGYTSSRSPQRPG